MDKNTILKELLSLSKRHLQSVIDENWEEWESVADKKEDLYGRLVELEDGSIDKQEKEIVLGIEELEEQTKQELGKKRDQVKDKLVRLSRVKGGLKSYRQIGKRASERHFSLRC